MSARPRLQVVAKREPVTVPARIAPLANLPLFHKLKGRKVVVAGGSQAALWKAELLSAAGADVLVLAGGEPAVALFDELSASPVSGTVVVVAREWTPADLADAAIAVADISGAEEARRFAAAARDAGVPANIIDNSDLGDFQFGSIINRSPVVLAVSTDGGAPMLGQSIRARIESVLPLGLTDWGKAAQRWRPLVKQRIRAFSDRRRFWQRFVELAWRDIGRVPRDSDLEALIGGVERGRAGGSVTLVGAGPGDPELLTLKAVRALQAATVILYDDLVGPDILELARREARRIAVGKTGHGPSCGQDDINRQIVALAQAGETVVRLKGGDPLIFGRAGEEIEACRAAGIEVALVPGISAVQGAAASLGFSLTERGSARRVQLVTGHGADGRLPEDIEWRAIADRAATTIVYMPRATLASFAERAIAAGLDAGTPVVAVASATLPAETHVRGTIGDIAARAAQLPKQAPLLVVIGAVARAPASADAGAAARAGAVS
ncbi:MAG TPA: siroheme synthase CysG [Allosphingosinicella sp.]|jgi:uroporphyrin-III C-methyltransferase/precorrin-2 dehydrogenase/sirohydrochlorin ferrochelatase